MHDMTKGAVLVTGGAGFIGSALIWALNQRGIENIYVTDFLGNDEKFKNLVPLRFRDYLEADRFMATLSQTSGNAFRDVATVFHLGACSATTEKDCRYLIENNFEYTKSLATWALSNKARFVYASSAATYGDGTQGMDDQDEDIGKLRPLNMYGYSKHLFDLFASKHQMLHQIVGLKYFNVYGPNEGHKEDMRSVVHKAFGQIQETGIIKLFKSYLPDYKDGEQMRDFLYVKDAVEMTLHLAENNNANGLFNLGSGKAHTWLDLASAIFKALNKEMKVEFIDMPEFLRPKYQYYTCADITKLRDTGYNRAIYSLEDAVKDYVQNYLVTGKSLGDELITADLANAH